MKEDILKQNEFAEFDSLTKTMISKLSLKLRQTFPNLEHYLKVPYNRGGKYFEHYSSHFIKFSNSSNSRIPTISIISTFFFWNKHLAFYIKSVVLQLPGQMNFNYYLVVALIMGILIYFTNFIIRKHKNSELKKCLNKIIINNMKNNFFVHNDIVKLHN